MKKILISLGALATLSAGAWMLHARTPEPVVDPAEILEQDNTAETDAEALTPENNEVSIDLETSIPFFYQTVGVGKNTVAMGYSTDGVEVNPYGEEVLTWMPGKGATSSYGDPVFSYLENGNWAMTAWTGPDDKRGAGNLLYNESTCPMVDDDSVIAIKPSTSAGCKQMKVITGGKTSQIFSYKGSSYAFHALQGDLSLAKLSDSDNSTMDLSKICVLQEPISKLSQLDYGDASILFDKQKTGLLLSDSAIAQRADGTWVLFAKGITMEDNARGKEASMEELCSRGIYKSTSKDLIHWSTPERVVSQASVPEATTMPDGTVRLYYQNFEKVCTTGNNSDAERAPISTVYELPSSYEMSQPEDVVIPGEAFEDNLKLHYATNGNPITVSSQAAMESLMTCMEN